MLMVLKILTGLPKVGEYLFSCQLIWYCIGAFSQGITNSNSLIALYCIESGHVIIGVNRH